MKKILAVLTLLATTSVAHAEPPYPRIMSGLFCTNAEDLRTVVENVKVLKRNALALVNNEKIVCVLHERSRVVVKAMKFVKSEKVDGGKYYLYEATVVGFHFGPSYVRIDPEMSQYVYMATPQKPEDAGEDA